MSKSVLLLTAAAMAIATCLATWPAAASSTSAELEVIQVSADDADTGEAGRGGRETSELLGSRALFTLVHALGIAGGAGLGIAWLIGLVIRWAKVSPRRRHPLVQAHMALAIPLGLLAMTHGTVLFFHEIFEGDWGLGGALGPGSWLCTLTFIMVVSGLGRRYNRARMAIWAKVHRIALWPWIITAVWHLVAELV